MQKSWIALAGVGLLAIGAAFLLLPSPDTGGDVPAAQPLPPGVDLAVGGAAPSGPRPVRVTPANAADGDDEWVNPDEPDGQPVAQPGVRGQHPGVAAMEVRNRPDAVTAGRASGPLGLVRQKLLYSDEPGAAEARDESARLISALRDMRRNPTGKDFDRLMAEQRAFATKIRGSSLMSTPEVPEALDRLDEILNEYEAERAKNP